MMKRTVAAQSRRRRDVRTAPAIAWADAHARELDAACDALFALPSPEDLLLVMQEQPDGSPAFYWRLRAPLWRQAHQQGDRVWAERFGRTPLPGEVPIVIIPRNAPAVWHARVRVVPNAPGGDA